MTTDFREFSGAASVCLMEDAALEESEIMDSKEPTGIGPESCESPDENANLLQVAQLLREKLDDLLATGTAAAAAPAMRDILDFAAPHMLAGAHTFSNDLVERRDRKVVATDGGRLCEHACAHHPALLNPAIWSRLPEEVLGLIFARLPLPDLHGLRRVSKQWRQNMTQDSSFRRLLTSLKPRFFAVVSSSMDELGMFWMRVFDLRANKWLCFPLYVRPDILNPAFQTMSACDGGLVCFVSIWKRTEENPLQIVVCNPLTGDQTALVLLSPNTHELEMVQLVHYGDTGHYKVIVVMQLQNKGLVAKLFDSEIRNWIFLEATGIVSEKPLCDYLPPFFGEWYTWDWEGSGYDSDEDSDDDDYIVYTNREGVCVYDYTRNDLDLLQDESCPLESAFVESHASVANKLFVLHKQQPHGNNNSNDDDDADNPEIAMKDYSITEYSGQLASPNWTKLRSMSLESLEVSPTAGASYSMELHASKGFIMVTVCNDKSCGQQRWLYEMATEEWRKLPGLLGEMDILGDDLMCELRWDSMTVTHDPEVAELAREFMGDEEFDEVLKRQKTAEMAESSDSTDDDSDFDF